MILQVAGPKSPKKAQRSAKGASVPGPPNVPFNGALMVLNRGYVGPIRGWSV